MVDFKKMADHSKLRKEIEQAINKHGLENGSNTPDFILAEYLTDCLRMFDKAVNKREEWYGRKESSNFSIAHNAIWLCVRAAIPSILALQLNIISRLTYSRCYGAFLIQNQNDSNSKISSSNLFRRGSS